MTTLPTLAVRFGTAAADPLPVDKPRDFVPFTYLFGPRANLAILLVLFVLLLGIGSSLVALAHAYGGTDPRSIEIYKLIGLCGIGLGQVAVLLRSQGNAAGIEKTRKVVEEVAEKTNGGLARAIEKHGEIVRAAERDQLITDPACKKAMEEMAVRIAEETARRVVGELKAGLER